jgi:HD-GYP domain-containing protein (c-di-GMP phosphodiesterase class II)
VATTAADAAARAAAAETELELIEATRDRVKKGLASRDFLVSGALGLAFLLVAVPLPFLVESERTLSVPLVVALVAAYAFACRVRFEVGIGAAVPTQLVFVPMLFLVPPALVPVLVALGLLAGNLPDFRRGLHLGRAIVLVTGAWYAVGPALVLVAAGEPAADWRAHWPVFALALAAQFAFDFASSAARAAGLGVALRPHLPAVALAYGVDLALSPLGLVVGFAAMADRDYAFLLALPLIGLIGFFARERRARIDHAVELGHAYRGTALLLGDVVEADDAYTGSHSRHVVDLVLAVGEELDLSPRDRRQAEFVALLHDVGKIRIPAEILNKPGKLDADEWALMQTHTIEGERMLEKVGGLIGEVGHLVRSCHERWDGDGYPDRLVGEETPLVARIVCACDAFSAMTTDRPYRSALSVEEALAELRRCSGTQFDPKVVDALVRVAS